MEENREIEVGVPRHNDEIIDDSNIADDLIP